MPEANGDVNLLRVRTRVSVPHLQFMGGAMHHKEAPTASPEAILKDVLDVLTCMHNGHFTPHLHETFPGVGGEIARLVNKHLEMLQDFRREHYRITEEVGVTGRLGGQGEVPGLQGAWKDMMDETNRMG